MAHVPRHRTPIAAGWRERRERPALADRGAIEPKNRLNRLTRLAHVSEQSEFGVHLVLVEERIGCRADGGMTRVVAEPILENGGGVGANGPGGEGESAVVATPSSSPRVRSVLAPPSSTEATQQSDVGAAAGAAVGTGLTWVAVVLAGGVVAELAASVGEAAGL